MILPLTSLRFFAAFMVVMHHYFDFEAGYAGVSFFYVLSGFVLALNNAEKVATWGERRLFWVRRLARVYPTHLLTLAVTVPLGWSVFTLPINALLLQSWVPVDWIYFGYNGPSWSISNEAFFYALFPFLIAWARPGVLVAWGVSLAVLAGAVALLLPGSTLSDPWIKFVFYIFAPMRLFEFVLGIALARLPARRFGTGAELAALAFAAAGLVLVYAPLPGPFTGSLIFIPGAAALVLVFAYSRGLLARLLSQPWLVVLGEASFALYMLHVPLQRYLPANAWYLAPLAVLLSLLLHRAFELPAQKAVLRAFGASRNRARITPGTAPA